MNLNTWKQSHGLLPKYTFEMTLEELQGEKAKLEAKINSERYSVKVLGKLTAYLFQIEDAISALDNFEKVKESVGLCEDNNA